MSDKIAPSTDTNAQELPDTLTGLTLNDHPHDEPAVVSSIKSKLDRAKGTNLDSLPAEITEQIVAYAKVGAVGSDGWPINDEHPVLKTMRLMSPAFNKVASQYLFNTVILYEHPDRYQALKNIAKTIYLAPLVEYVQLANLGFLPDCSIQNGAPSISWEKDLNEEEEGQIEEGASRLWKDEEGQAEEGRAEEEAEERKAVEGQEDQEPHDCLTSEKCGSFKFWQSITDRYHSISQTIFSYPPAGGPLAKLDFSPDAIYARYVTWRDGEFAMKGHIKNDTAPHLDLYLLPNLQSLEAVGLKEMRVVERSRGNGHYWHTRPETRRFFETGLIEANALFGSFYPTLTHLPTFMIAASACGKNLTSLTVHRVDELFKDREHDYSNPAIGLPCLRSLKLDLRDVWYDYTSMTDPAALAPWMHNLGTLKELHISQNPGAVHNQADVLSLLQELHFPKLTKVDLKDGILDFRFLSAFLSKYQETLSLVKINRPFMEKDHWKEICMQYGSGSRFAEGKIVCLSEKVGDEQCSHW